MARRRRIAILLAAGLLINLAVAWACAWLHLPCCEQAVDVDRDGAAALRGWPAEVPASWPLPDYFGCWATFGSRHVEASAECDDPPYFCNVYVERAGFPAPALISTRLEGIGIRQPSAFSPWKLLSWSEGWTVPAPHGLVVPLPLTPVWWGLMLNTVVYALTLHEGASIFNAARTRRRSRRGLCGGCGYPAPGPDTVCPECGAPT